MLSPFILIYKVTHSEEDAAVQNAREIDRTMNEKREYDSLFADQNIDRAVKVMTYIVFILIAPIICVVSVLSLRLRRQTELCKSKRLRIRSLDSLLKPP